MSTAGAIMRTLRPHQWVKNMFVVAPLVFAQHLFELDYVLRTLAATAAFCALSGAVYAFNDVRDVEQDRAHPRKKFRPIAAGELSERGALILAGLLIVAALGGSLALSWKLAAVGAGYVVVNLSYSLALKQVAWLDVGLIASGFLLRVTAGAFAIDVPVSGWLLGCTGLLATLLGLGKRAHELHLAELSERTATETRAALAGYNANTVRVVMLLLALATCVVYALYTQDTRTIAEFGTRQLVWTLPFCVLGIGRFVQLAIISPTKRSPTEAMLRDWPFLLNIAVWATVVLLIIYRTS